MLRVLCILLLQNQECSWFGKQKEFMLTKKAVQKSFCAYVCFLSLKQSLIIFPDFLWTTRKH